MGSKQALSNGNEPEEVTDLLTAFEQQNTVRIILTASVELHNGYLDTKWVASLVEREDRKSGASLLGLQSVTVWGGDYKTLMGLVTRLLYALDFQLALNEFEKVAPKRA